MNTTKTIQAKEEDLRVMFRSHYDGHDLVPVVTQQNFAQITAVRPARADRIQVVEAAENVAVLRMLHFTQQNIRRMHINAQHVRHVLFAV